MSILAPHLLQSSSTEGASALGFSPDSTKLVVATSLSGNVLVVEFGQESAGKRVTSRISGAPKV